MRALVAGLGNELRGDDGAGPAVALRVACAARSGVRVVVNVGEPADLIEAWRHTELAVVVDAMDAGLEAGASRRFELPADGLAGPGAVRTAGTSTHALSLPQVIELARALDALPGRLLVFAVQGDDFGPGEGLTPAVQRAVERVAGEILEELGAALAP